MQKIRTGHEVFDYISNLIKGSIILVLDEGHFESLMFLNALLSSYAKQKPVVVLTSYEVLTNFEQIRLDRIGSISDLSILVSQVREKIGEGIIIHHYLPQLLIQENESTILKAIEHWTNQLHGKHILEFLTLPKGTFPTFERTLQVLLPGFINLSFLKKDEYYYRTFSIQKACKVEYHGVDFPYILKDGKLLIKFLDEFTDKIPVAEKEVIEQKKAHLLDHIYDSRLVVSEVEYGKLKPSDYVLLTQLHGMHLADVKLIFPDKFDEILEKIARWIIEGIAKIEPAEKREERPPKGPSLKVKLALKFPTWLTLKLISKRPVRRIPREAFAGLRKTVDMIFHMYFPGKEEEPLQTLRNVEEIIQEIAGRITAVEHTKQLGEDPKSSLSISYLPKIASLTLFQGFGLSCEIMKISGELWRMKVKDCFVCKDVKSNRPECHIVSGTISGALSIIFKQKFICEEIECKAMGHPACVFMIRKM